MRLLEIPILLHHSHFYSHAYKRRDFSVIHNRNSPVISTLTPCILPVILSTISFLLLRPCGTWQESVDNLPETLKFLLTRLLGAWPVLPGGADRIRNFYSQAHRGRDRTRRQRVHWWWHGISTHTPARGVTPIFCILGRSRHHITQGGLIFLMILNHTSIKNYIFPGEPSGDFGVIEGSLFCEWISI